MAARRRARPRSVPAAAAILVAAGAAGGIAWNAVVPRGIFRPVPVVVPSPPPPPPPKHETRRRPPKNDQTPVPPPVEPAWEGIKVIDLAEARKLLDTGGALFVDARSAIGYEFAHIPGAWNLPFSDFDAAYAKVGGKLPKDAPIVVYCTSGSCDEASITLEHMKAQGYRKLMHFKDGWNTWEIAEYPQEKGPGPQ